MLAMTTLVATSVVRGSRQGESHGGVYLIDLDNERVLRTVDWDTGDIDWQGRGWDRGLRGIAFDGDRVFIAATNFSYTTTRSINSRRIAAPTSNTVTRLVGTSVDSTSPRRGSILSLDST